VAGYSEVAELGRIPSNQGTRWRVPAKPIGGADCVKPSEPNVKEVTMGGV